MKRFFNCPWMKIALVLTPVIFFTVSRAQIVVSNVNKIPKLRTGTTFVVMKNPESDTALKYIEIYKKYWTFNEIEFIPDSLMSSVLDWNTTFLTLNWDYKYSYPSGNVFLYLTLWYVDEKFMRGKKKFSNDDIIPVVQIELFPAHNLIGYGYELYMEDYDFGGRIHSWSPGLLKNYILQMTAALNAGQLQPIGSEIINKKKLKELKTKTLYIPDYILIKFEELTDGETGSHREDRLMKDYKYRYKLVTSEELSKRCLEDPDDFYYLLYVKSYYVKSLHIINGVNGEVVFSKRIGKGRNITGKDIKRLAMEIR